MEAYSCSIYYRVWMSYSSLECIAYTNGISLSIDATASYSTTRTALGCRIIMPSWYPIVSAGCIRSSEVCMSLVEFVLRCMQCMRAHANKRYLVITSIFQWRQDHARTCDWSWITADLFSVNDMPFLCLLFDNNYILRLKSLAKWSVFILIFMTCWSFLNTVKYCDHKFLRDYYRWWDRKLGIASGKASLWSYPCVCI